MTVTTEAKNKHKLSAVTKEHGFIGYEDITTPYTIFNTDMENYYIVLESGKLDGDELFRAISKFIASQTKNAFDINMDSFKKVVGMSNHDTMANVVVNAIEYGSVTPWSAKTTQSKSLNHQFLVSCQNCIAKASERKVVAEDRTFARRLQDMPSNQMTPGAFVREMTKHFEGLNVKISVLNRKELEDKGMNLLVGVGQAAEKDDDQPRLMVVEYLGNPDNREQLIGFVGKGVCFDTGGMNVKPGNHMRWMKYDMSGAAIVGSTVHALAKNQIKVNAVAVMPLVLNLADTNAIRPDDVLVSYNGMTVEIDNTDAEGRLILADAITYAIRDLKVNEIYDIATLTGAMIYALGDTYTGVWASSDELWNNIQLQADNAGELVWRLPFHHDFKDLLKSKYADIANSVSDARGGSSRAAMFLKEFTEGLPYGHFDIAATGDKGNTGTGAMLNVFYNIAKSKQSM